MPAAVVVILLTVATVIVIHCHCSSCSPPHEQLLEVLGAGSVSSVVIIERATSTLQADACSSGAGACHCHCHHSLSAFHEQSLKEPGVGGALSAVHTYNLPYEHWLIGMERMHECWVIFISSCWLS
jgi:hypothetical protein